MSEVPLSIHPYRYRTRSAGEVDAEWGEISVPERRDGGAGRVALPFVRLAGTGERTGPPVVFLAGGPGESAIEAGKGRLYALFDALRALGDVILLDQRGCGNARPSLECRDHWEFPLDEALTRERALEVALEGSRRCAARLRAGGVDLSAYNAAESADDVDDLRRALEVGQIHVVATSYGTHLAMSLMRRHRDAIARAVLAGPEGPDHTYKLPSAVQRQLERITARVRTDEVLWRTTGNFADNVRTVLADLERNPRSVRITDPRSGEEVEAVVSRFDVEYITSVGAADTRLIAILPAWYARMALGDFSDIAGHDLLRRYYLHLHRELGGSAVGFCCDCASGASAPRLRRIAVEEKAYPLGRTIDFPFPEIGEAWGVHDLGDDFRAPLESDVPTLFLTGTWDCRTPAENAVELLPGFANARHVVIEEAGHTDLLFGTGVARVVARFLDGENMIRTPIHSGEAVKFIPPAE